MTPFRKLMSLITPGQFLELLPRKASPAAHDLIPIEDSADSYRKKHVRVDDLTMTPGAHAGSHVTGGGDVIANAVSGGNAGLMSGADKAKLNAIEAAADVTDAGNVTAAGAVMKTLLTAKGSIISASSASTPVEVPIGTPGQFARVGAGGMPEYQTYAPADQHVFSAHAAVDLVDDTSEISAALNGEVGKHFVPMLIVAQITARTGSPNGDAHIQVGTASGLSDILATTELTGLDAVDELYYIPIPAGLGRSTLGNATVFVKCATEDTGATTLVARVWVLGMQF